MSCESFTKLRWGLTTKCASPVPGVLDVQPRELPHQIHSVNTPLIGARCVRYFGMEGDLHSVVFAAGT